MNTSSSKLYVLVGDKSVCIRIQGLANFHSSVDFKTLMTELRQRGFEHFVLDLTDCVLMDSTFLGVLAGFGLKLRPSPGEEARKGVHLYRASPRVLQLLESLGVLHLFSISSEAPACAEAPVAPSREASREEMAETCMAAHQTLIDINPENETKFKEVTAFLADDLKR
jgi:anti-anti-sigma factor